MVVTPLAFAGIADLCMMLAYLGLAAALLIGRRRIGELVGERRFVTMLLAFSCTQALAHLWHTLDRGQEVVSTPREIVDVLALASVVALVSTLPNALRCMCHLSEQAKRTAEAEARVRLRDEFLQVAAHELKTPVTSIQGFGQLIMRLIRSGTTDPASLLRRLDAQQASIRRLTRLVDELLDYSKMTAGQLQLQLAEVDLVRLLHDAARDVEYRRNGGRITAHTPPELVVCGDGTRLYQVLVNLLDNAIKYSSGPVEITMRGAGDHGAEVMVRDWGPGVPELSLSDVFVPFHRHGSDPHVEGLGLGLAISHDIVAMHGGTLSVRNHPDGGAEFGLRLPQSPDTPLLLTP